MTQEEIVKFQEKILSWYIENKRDLPWRSTKDPYKILVSEIMSQQTQISRVIPKYEAWLQKFPDVQSLATAPVSEVLIYWSGLGYNRRALNLQRAAKILAKQSSLNDERSSQRLPRTIKWPKTTRELTKLPGIGQYTASAVACFAFDAQIPVIDTNIRKVIAVEFFQGQLPDEKIIADIAREILPKGRASEWNQALMDYSSLVLKTIKIPIAKQSHFKSSDRWYRGQTVKLLLEIKRISFSGLLDYFADKNPIDGERLETILSKLAKDGLVDYEDNAISMRE
ncbi:MAG: A/G-specific adenine glycosylase [Candidatus Levybacteria bacterium]|nr:A/G-specific adenine glycosylase [Candidatus Levybacteria bacterium]